MSNVVPLGRSPRILCADCKVPMKLEANGNFSCVQKGCGKGFIYGRKGLTVDRVGDNQTLIIPKR